MIHVPLKTLLNATAGTSPNGHNLSTRSSAQTFGQMLVMPYLDAVDGRMDGVYHYKKDLFGPVHVYLVSSGVDLDHPGRESGTGGRARIYLDHRLF
jgi:hypothetical protein